MLLDTGEKYDSIGFTMLVVGLSMVLKDASCNLEVTGLVPTIPSLYKVTWGPRLPY